jgi:hypothetical protein
MIQEQLQSNPFTCKLVILHISLHVDCFFMSLFLLNRSFKDIRQHFTFCPEIVSFLVLNKAYFEGTVFMKWNFSFFFSNSIALSFLSASEGKKRLKKMKCHSRQWLIVILNATFIRAAKNVCFVIRRPNKLFGILW